MSIFQRSVTYTFFQELYSHIDKNSGKKSEDIFLFKIASEGTSLNELIIAPWSNSNEFHLARERQNVPGVPKENSSTFDLM